MKLINARLIDGTGAAPVENATLRFTDHIQAGADGDQPDGPADGETLDVGGRTVIPGLINAHVHLVFDAGSADTFRPLRDEPPGATALRAAARAQRMLQAGITTARDLGGYNYLELAVRDLIRSGE